jgi:hypothetical protein
VKDDAKKGEDKKGKKPAKKTKKPRFFFCGESFKDEGCRHKHLTRNKCNPQVLAYDDYYYFGSDDPTLHRCPHECGFVAVDHTYLLEHVRFTHAVLKCNACKPLHDSR